MKHLGRINLIVATVAVASISVGAITGLWSESSMFMGTQAASEQQAPKSYIIQGGNADTLVAVVEQAGGDVSRQFPIINAISAMLTPAQADQIKTVNGVRILDDRTVKTMSNSKKYAIDTYVTTQINANELHDMGITGRGVTVAVVDSGSNMGGDSGQYLFADSEGEQRIAVKYNAFESKETYYYNDDNNGHGSHVTGIIASSLQDASRDFNGVAPDVYLVSVKAFDKNGNSSYSAILDSLNWIAENISKYKIKVVNLSLGAQAQSRYWNDPINQAVMYLWYKGVTVVTSAGNNGEQMGITVPGNNPYVITVGSSSHNDSPYNTSDDRVASFSSQGPTYEGFVKPDVVAPGTNIAVKIEDKYLSKKLRQSSTGEGYSEVSGTSQSAAVVSGIAALIIQAYPGISPDDVKCKILHSAKVARNKSKYAYSPLIQGSGMVNALDAVRTSARACANQGLDIRSDLTGSKHFVGSVGKKSNYWTVSLSNGKVLNQGKHWNDSKVNTNNAHWSNEVIELEGSHWSNESVGMHSAHWSNEMVKPMGSHWTSESVGLHSAGLDVAVTSAEANSQAEGDDVPIETEGWQ
ncbi:S8 family peptidase [Glaciecola siphonariae]|uniref:S8 family peptidase n=1 Tax=Glaciecola siphonariae TaxID=521012 RepID=A0ABV9LWV0_9ALTE